MQHFALLKEMAELNLAATPGQPTDLEEFDAQLKCEVEMAKMALKMNQLPPMPRLHKDRQLFCLTIPTSKTLHYIKYLHFYIWSLSHL